MSRLATEKLERNGLRGRRGAKKGGRKEGRRDICIKSFFISPFTADRPRPLLLRDSRGARISLWPYGRGVKTGNGSPLSISVFVFKIGCGFCVARESTSSSGCRSSCLLAKSHLTKVCGQTMIFSCRRRLNIHRAEITLGLRSMFKYKNCTSTCIHNAAASTPI